MSADRLQHGVAVMMLGKPVRSMVCIAGQMQQFDAIAARLEHPDRTRSGQFNDFKMERIVHAEMARHCENGDAITAIAAHMECETGRAVVAAHLRGR